MDLENHVLDCYKSQRDILVTYLIISISGLIGLSPSDNYDRIGLVHKRDHYCMNLQDYTSRYLRSIIHTESPDSNHSLPRLPVSPSRSTSRRNPSVLGDVRPIQDAISDQERTSSKDLYNVKATSQQRGRACCAQPANTEDTCENRKQ